MKNKTNKQHGYSHRPTYRVLALSICLVLGYAIGYGVAFLFEGKDGKSTMISTREGISNTGSARRAPDHLQRLLEDKTLTGVQKVRMSRTLNMRDLSTYYGTLSVEELDKEFMRVMPFADTSFDSVEGRRMLLVLAHLGKKDPERGYELISSYLNKGVNEIRAFNVLFRSWMESDSTVAMAFFQKNKDAPGLQRMNRALLEKGDNIMGLYATESVRRSPEEALKWYGSLSPEDREQASMSLVKELARRDLSMALKEWDKLSDAEKSNAAFGLEESWGREDPAAFLDWGRTQDKVSEESTLRILSKLGRQDFDKALAYVDKLGDPDRCARARAELAGLLIGQNPRDVADKLSALGSPDMVEVLKNHAEKVDFYANDENARAWLSTIPPDHPDKGEIVLDYVNEAPMRDQATMISALEMYPLNNFSISDVLEKAAVIDGLDSDMRAYFGYETLLKSWYLKEPERVKNYIRTSRAFAEKDKEDLLRSIISQ